MLIRDHADALEADLAYRGIDIRDLWRPGSGLTPRRLWVLFRALPPTAGVWQSIEAVENRSLKPTPDQIRAAAERYRR